MEIAWECSCGTMAGSAESKNAKGYRAVCLCNDCQAYAHWLGRAADVLDKNGGTDIFPMQPARLRITRGLDRLACVRLSAKGMYRWYAGCCKTPIGNSMPQAWMGYVGLVHTAFEKKNSSEQINEAFGPIRLRMMARFGIGPLPPDAVEKVTASFLLRVLKFIAVTKFFGLGSPSPFLNADGGPIVEPKVLNVTERDALRPLCGPK